MRFALIPILLAALTTPALAQFYLDTPKGYTLAAVPAGQSNLLAAGDGVRQAAAQCSGISLDGVFRVESGMSRYYEFDRGRGEKPQVREYAIAATHPFTGTRPAAAKYAIEGRPIYIAFGTVANDGYNDYVVASFLENGSGIEELSRFTLGAEYCGGIYAMDLNNDGVIELAAPYSTGASGGGIEVRAIVPTGGLAWFGNDELDSTLFSQTGYINLLDYDGDGDWEIETSAPVLCSACGYMWHDLWTFDNEGWNWEAEPAKFPAYYKPEQDFYRQLNTVVQQLAGNPAHYKYSGKVIEAQYATQIGGQWYSLDVFMDGDKVDKTWVSQLASLVSGWK